MAPSHSKLSQPEITGPRKRTASSRITDENFTGAESNVVTKRLKLSATGNRGTSRAAAVKPQQRQASFEDADDEDSTPVNNPPKNPKRLLEAADGSDDIEMPDDDPPPALEDTEPYGADDDDDDDEPEVAKPVETAEAQRGESKKPVNCCTN